MLFYKPKDTILQDLHPATLLFYLVAVVAGALIFNHPLLLLAILLAVVVSLLSAGGGKSWAASVKYFFYMILMLLVINTLANNLGRTVIWSGFRVPFWGTVNLTAEVVAFSLVMALRLLIIYSAFVLYNTVLDPDRALSLFAGVFPRSTLLVALATKSIPYLGQQLRRAAEIQQCRGIYYRGGGLRQRIQSRIPLVKVVFLSSLEDSFNIGESIQARAYGSGPRTRYVELAFKSMDALVLAASLLGVAVMAWSFARGWGSLDFFPQIQGSLVSPQHLTAAGLIALCLLVPALITWGCRKWEYCR